MKKRILYLIIPIVLAACSNDFINLIPYSTVSVDILYKTDNDFRDAVVGSYAILQSQYQNHYIYGDIRGDDAEIQIVKNDSWSYADLFIMTSTDGTLNSTWGNYYSLIFRANTILEQIEDADPAIVTNKAQHIAETKFLRALAYFDLVRIFGDVPLVLNTISAREALKIPRTKTDLVYEQIIADLIACESVLPRNYTGANVGRATNGAAKSLLGKVYLTRNEFTKAENKLQEVTAMGYALLADYNALFDYAKDKHHSEYIFDVEYATNCNVTNHLTNKFLSNQAAFLRYFGVVGVGGESCFPSLEYRDLFDENDQRKYISVGVYRGWMQDGEFIEFTSTNTSMGYTMKYITPIPATNDSPANWKVTRYGDVVLMYAEALNENGKTAEALTWLNMIRTRAGVSTFSGLTQNETREAIILERRLELFMEGHRWFDLVRTGRAYQTLSWKGMQPYMNVFPIPWSQIQVVNDPTILWQNEGYS